MYWKNRHSGFTLVELMIVISMIMILMGISLFPYNYYMDRARVEKNIDTISQEWILAHNDVKNGILYDTESNAHLYVYLFTGSNQMDIYMSTGGASPQKLYKSVALDRGIEIQSFSGIDLGSATGVIYHIIPPYALGMYATGSTEYALTGITMTI